MINEKAVLLRDDYCDGLGDCLPVCPTGAISFEEREALQYNEAEVQKNKREERQRALSCGCPGSNAVLLAKRPELEQREEVQQKVQEEVYNKAQAEAQIGEQPREKQAELQSKAPAEAQIGEQSREKQEETRSKAPAEAQKRGQPREKREGVQSAAPAEVQKGEQPREKRAELQNGEQAEQQVKMQSTAGATPASQLRQWPVQIKLAPASAPYFDGAKLLIAADCAAYAYANFHEDFIKGKITLIGCPKLDEGDYAEKLTTIFSQSNIKSVTVVRMEVPCCGGIENAVVRALENCGKLIQWQIITLSIEGTIIE